MKPIWSALMLGIAVPALARAAPQAAAETASPARLAAARQLVGLLNLEQTLDQMFVPLMPVFAQAVIGALQGDPDTRDAMRVLLEKGEGGQDRFVTILSQEFFSSLRARYPDLKESAATEYAKTFSESELRDLIAFYTSGTGAKMLSLAPHLQKRLAAAGQEIGRKAGEEAGRRAFERAEQEMLPRKAQTSS
jgi:hypothetical protein